MLRFRQLFTGTCIAVGLLPWNATAINQDQLTTRLFSQVTRNSLSGSSSLERMLVQTLQSIKEGHLQQAQERIDQLLSQYPNFALAHLIQGDLLSAKAGALTGFGNPNLTSNPKIQDFKDEAETRIRNFFDQSRGLTQPNLLAALSSKQSHILFIDTAKSRLYVYQKQADDSLKYVADYYVTIGKNGVGKKDQGDKRTPIGVYFASRKLSGPLPDLYGDAAYPLNYPNEIDAFEHKSGSGIWIHGTPHDIYSRPPKASDGCVVLSNPDMKALQEILQQGNTPVVIGVNFQWVSPDTVKNQQELKEDLRKSIEAWRLDWVSQESDRYLSHYAQGFFYNEGRLDKWSSYKRQIQSAKPKVSIRLDEFSMFTYPNATQPMVVVDFNQEFTSPTLHNTMRKRQYWIQDNGHWKILYEGAA